MSDVRSQVDQLIADRGKIDPRLYRALQLLNQQLGKITQSVEGLELQSELDAVVAGGSLEAPVVAHIFTGLTLRLYWAEVDGAVYYEVRKGTVWDTAVFQTRTPNLQVDLDPILIGSHTYLIKSINADLEYSDDTYTLNVQVPQIPNVVVTGQVIDNNIILSWNTPASVFDITHYEIFKDGVSLGIIRGTFLTRFEAVSGTYIYQVIATDLAGNKSSPISASVSLEVSQPPDYVLQFRQLSTLAGTRVKVGYSAFGGLPLLTAVIVDETWEDHFINNAWSNIQAQITAGFPIYIQPTDTGLGTYQEDIDFGTLFASSIVTITWNYVQFGADPVNIVVKMATSTDGISFSAFTSGASQFLTNLRYLRLKLEFTGVNNKSLIDVWNLIINVDVKREVDGGEVSALSTDAGGTAVLFNKDFKDIDSITATVKNDVGEPFIVIIEFLDIPDPVGFDVYAFDTSGIRVSKTVEWKARGII